MMGWNQSRKISFFPQGAGPPHFFKLNMLNKNPRGRGSIVISGCLNPHGENRASFLCAPCLQRGPSRLEPCVPVPSGDPPFKRWRWRCFFSTNFFYIVWNREIRLLETLNKNMNQTQLLVSFFVTLFFQFFDVCVDRARRSSRLQLCYPASCDGKKSWKFAHLITGQLGSCCGGVVQVTLEPYLSHGLKYVKVKQHENSEILLRSSQSSVLFPPLYFTTLLRPLIL